MKIDENQVLRNYLHARTVAIPFPDGNAEEVWMMYKNGTWLAYEIGKGEAEVLASATQNPAAVAIDAALTLRKRREEKRQEDKKKQKSRAALDEFESKLTDFRNGVVSGLNKLTEEIKKIRE